MSVDSWPGRGQRTFDERSDCWETRDLWIFFERNERCMIKCPRRIRGCIYRQNVEQLGQAAHADVAALE